MKNDIFLHNNVILKKCHYYEEKYYFSFFLQNQRKDRPKIYIIALDIFFFIFYFIFFNYKSKTLNKKIEPLTFHIN
jgi:hypothetical protein